MRNGLWTPVATLKPKSPEIQVSELLKKIDARAKLAGTNKLELLLFSLGMDSRTERRETYGINVFKVREVMRTPTITRAPEMPATVEGMVSLRGSRRHNPSPGLVRHACATKYARTTIRRNGRGGLHQGSG